MGRGEGDPETRGTSCAIPSWNVPKSNFWGGETEKVSPKVLLDQAIDEKVSPKVSLDRKCHQKLRDLRNRESDQNLSVIKIAGNQKLCTNTDFLLIKVQRLRRNLPSKFLPLCLCASLRLCLFASVPLCCCKCASLPLCLFASVPLCLLLYLYNFYSKIRIKVY